MICVAAVTRGNFERFSPSPLKAGGTLSSLLQLLNQGLKKHFHVPTSAFWCNGVWISRPEGNSALGTVTGQGLRNASSFKTEPKWGLCFAAASRSACLPGLHSALLQASKEGQAQEAAKQQAGILQVQTQGQPGSSLLGLHKFRQHSSTLLCQKKFWLNYQAWKPCPSSSGTGLGELQKGWSSLHGSWKLGTVAGDCNRLKFSKFN